MPVAAALDILAEEAGSHFDPDLVPPFFAMNARRADTLAGAWTRCSPWPRTGHARENGAEGGCPGQNMLCFRCLGDCSERAAADADAVRRLGTVVVAAAFRGQPRPPRERGALRDQLPRRAGAFSVGLAARIILQAADSGDGSRHGTASTACASAACRTAKSSSTTARSAVAMPEVEYRPRRRLDGPRPRQHQRIPPQRRRLGRGPNRADGDRPSPAKSYCSSGPPKPRRMPNRSSD